MGTGIQKTVLVRSYVPVRTRVPVRVQYPVYTVGVPVYSTRTAYKYCIRTFCTSTVRVLQSVYSVLVQEPVYTVYRYSSTEYCIYIHTCILLVPVYRYSYRYEYSKEAIYTVGYCTRSIAPLQVLVQYSYRYTVYEYEYVRTGTYMQYGVDY